MEAGIVLSSESQRTNGDAMGINIILLVSIVMMVGCCGGMMTGMTRKDGRRCQTHTSDHP